MKPSKTLLLKILNTVVDEWGFEEVSDSLRGMSLKLGANGFSPRSRRETEPGRRHTRPSAVLQTERTDLSHEQRGILLGLAERFDRKEFLPTIADVREFLILSGQRPVIMKDRSEAFRVLLRFLHGLPIDRLSEIATAESHSGPSRLGPLSDAISTAGGRIQRQKTFVEMS